MTQRFVTNTEFGANYKLSGLGQGGYLQQDVYGEQLEKKQE